MLNTLMLDFFAAPERFIQQASAAQWTQFLQQARQHGLSARFYYLLQRKGLLAQVPQQVQQHGLSAARYAEKQQQALFSELQQLEPLFAEAEYPCLLLKGAAYRCRALPVSYGRLFADIDMLVPAAQLRLTRDKLFFYGFHEVGLSDYDRAYYLNWSHQNPPLQHYQRGTVIDLHHHIYPTASARKIDISPIFSHAEALPGSAFKLPKSAHLFIHAAVHLFYQEETHKLQKDLIDLNDLLLQVQQEQQLDFMLQQATLMTVQSAVANACQILAEVFANPAAQHCRGSMRLSKAQPLVCYLLLSMLRGDGPRAWLAQQLWFVRGHKLKMRWQVLLYHTLAKPAAAIRQWLKRALHSDIKRR